MAKQDLLGIEGMKTEDIVEILDSAESFEEIAQRPVKKVPTLRGKTVINLFFEASTRTRTSFEVAGKRLSADVINVSASGSSVSKGETLIDTTRTLDAMSPDCIVIRHSSSGVPYQIAKHSQASVINAGDGAHEHPTQALLDAYTIRRRKEKLDGLKIAIVGDVLHSRVARSNLLVLTAFESHVWLAAAPTLMPSGIERITCSENPFLHTTHSMDEAIEDADVVMMLRVQFERMTESFFPSTREYYRYFGLTAERLKLAKPDVVVMHPGPINRGIEIDAEVADGPSFGDSRPGLGRRRRPNGYPLQAVGERMKIVVKNGHLIDPGRDIDRVGDLLIEEGKIAAVGNVDALDALTVDAAGLVVAPGFFDIHVHLREPGAEEAETLRTGGEAAVAGGFTAVAAMPNTRPPIDTASLAPFYRFRSSPALPGARVPDRRHHEGTVG